MFYPSHSSLTSHQPIAWVGVPGPSRTKSAVRRAFRQLLCLQSRSKFAPCAKLNPEESRWGRPAIHCVLSLPQAGRQRFFPTVIATCNIIVEIVDEIY